MKKALPTAVFALCAFATFALDRIVDEAALLSDSEKIALSYSIENIIAQYNFDLVIVTQNSLNGKAAQDFADDYFDYGGYGLGEARDGILFLVGMDERVFYLSTSGRGIQAFTDYGIRRTNERMTSSLREARYAQAFTTLLNDTEYYLDCLRSGSPFDRAGKDSETKAALLFIIALTSVSIALIVSLVLRARLKNVLRRYVQHDYVRPGSFNVTYRSDQFLYTNTTKTVRQSNGTDSGGSSTHTSSSGRTHGGGGGSF